MRIIYFDLDCTRPDHLGVYGYNRETSPAIDELAETAVVDPMHAQITGFEYFPVEQMFQRLAHLGRQDQIEDLRARLAQGRQRMPPPYPASRY